MPKEYSPTSSARAISSSRCAIRSSGPTGRSVEGSVTAATKLSTPTCTAVLLGWGPPPATVQCSTSQPGGDPGPEVGGGRTGAVRTPECRNRRPARIGCRDPARARTGGPVPVDPHIAALLTMLAEIGLPPMHEGTPEAARTQYLTLSAARSSELVVPVGAVEETTVPGAEGDLRARVYRPEGEGPFPTVAFFHGGGWVIGDLDPHDRSVREICRGARAVVVAVDYRLAPEHPFPAAAEDAVAAARWIAAHRGELGGDDRLAVAGDSAGGNLAAVVAQ